MVYMTKTRNQGIINPSNCKADTIKKDYQEKMFFDWKIYLVKVQLTNDLRDDTILYQRKRIPCKMIKDIAILPLGHGNHCLVP